MSRLGGFTRIFPRPFGKTGRKCKKDPIGGNKAKNTLKTQHLTFSGTQNELLFEFRNPDQTQK
jgi:hypothetical protein